MSWNNQGWDNIVKRIQDQIRSAHDESNTLGRRNIHPIYCPIKSYTNYNRSFQIIPNKMNFVWILSCFFKTWLSFPPNSIQLKQRKKHRRLSLVLPRPSWNIRPHQDVALGKLRGVGLIPAVVVLKAFFLVNVLSRFLAWNPVNFGFLEVGQFWSVDLAHRSCT